MKSSHSLCLMIAIGLVSFFQVLGHINPICILELDPEKLETSRQMHHKYFTQFMDKNNLITCLGKAVLQPHYLASSLSLYVLG